MVRQFSGNSVRKLWSTFRGTPLFPFGPVSSISSAENNYGKRHSVRLVCWFWKNPYHYSTLVPTALFWQMVSTHDFGLGEDGRPAIVGSSVHNQRIEHHNRSGAFSLQVRILWPRKGGCFLEPLNEIDLFCLHHVYLPSLDKNLSEFVSAIITIKYRPKVTITRPKSFGPIFIQHSLETAMSQMMH